LNINTKEYWEERFRSGNWGRGGRKQTLEYAKANVSQIRVPENFTGTILDFGCALGDAIPVYRAKYPKAKVSGYDISQKAIDYCRKKYGSMTDFYTGDINEIPDKDIIIASHVMEHIVNDKELVRDLLDKCKELYVFVPYMESPLYHEHVNRYDINYYTELKPIDNRIFNVSYRKRNTLKDTIKQALRFRLSLFHRFTKSVIMFHFKSALDQNR